MSAPGSGGTLERRDLMELLYYHNGALGDFVTAIPCLKLIRRRHPSTRITLLGRPLAGELAVSFALAERVLDAGSSTYRSLFSAPVDASLHRALGAPDLAYLVTDSPALVSAFRSMPCRVLHHPSLPPAGTSAYAWHAALALQAAGSSEEPSTSVTASAGQAEVTWALQAPLLSPGPVTRSPVALIHPGSGSAAKNWPAARFLSLAAELRALGLRLTWSFGPADGEARGAIARELTSADRVLDGATPLELTRELARASLYVGCDSGVSHLAAAIGCPTVMIFGPTSVEVWRPPGEHVRVIVRRDLCSNASRHLGACVIPVSGVACVRRQGVTPRCLVGVRTEDVVRECLSLLGASGRSGPSGPARLAAPPGHG